MARLAGQSHHHSVNKTIQQTGQISRGEATSETDMTCSQDKAGSGRLASLAWAVPEMRGSAGAMQAGGDRLVPARPPATTASIRGAEIELHHAVLPTIPHTISL